MNRGTKITYKSVGTDPNGENRAVLKNTPNLEAEKELRGFLEDDNKHFVCVTDHEIFAVNKLVHCGSKFLQLEPNPVTFYFSIAFDLVPQLESMKKQLSAILAQDTRLNGSLLVTTYSAIFKISSIGVVFSFLAVEAFMNQQLPDYFEIQFKNKTATKDKIQRWASFEDKLMIIVPQVSGKDFCKDYPKRGDTIRKLKKLRDELIHLKQQRKDGLTSYNEIYQDVLDVNLKSLVANVKFYINYYQPKTIRNYKVR